jgi:predicted nucleic-acid-binding Zn-ribbon protein
MEENKVVVFTTFKSKTGFIVHATQRGDDLDTAYRQLGEFITKQGGVPYEKQSGFPKKEKDYVPERSCPKCGSKLVKSTTKTGKEMIKCETNKWNFQTKQAEGCDYIEWGKSDFEKDMEAANA